ncbi:hypothetical protein ACHWQZ_G003715 [Mnemiopsis leidyi]
MSAETVEEYKEVFERFDTSSKGSITTNSLGDALAACGAKVPGFKVRDIQESYTEGVITFDDFCKILNQVRSKNTFKETIKPIELKKKVNVNKGSEKSSEWTTHSYAEEEKLAFVDWINFRLAKDELLLKLGSIPISEEGEALFAALRDGIIMNKLVNDSVEDTVDERALNLPSESGNLSIFKIQENQTLALNSCVAIGCNVVNIGAEDLINGKAHLCLGLLWQVIRIGLMAKITLKDCPGLRALLDEFETLEQLLAMSPEEILCRWVNYQLNKVGCKRVVKNFTHDIKDSEVYAHLLVAVCPEDKGPIGLDPLNIQDLTKRAEMVLDNAEMIDARSFVRAHDIVNGNQKLNLAFVANLFNMYPAMDAVEGFEIIEETREEKIHDILDDLEEALGKEGREEKAMRNWMNSCGATPRVKYIYEDLKDGLAIIQLFDKIQKGCVNWKKVNTPPFKALGGAMKQIENCNYAIDLGHNLGFVLVGIDGKNLHDGDKLTLGLVWQMMRHYTLAMLTHDGKIMKDNEIIKWCNDKLAEKGKTSSFSSFKDSSLGNSRTIVDLIDAISPGYINYDLVTAAGTDDEKFLNARYAITMARKIGARIFALPEDITEVNPKMIMTVFACLMSVGFAKDQQKK